ncbi:hypothetical protein SAY87_009738 [Trapa incisa]|uniref:Uncharacterized protein n=1 Tax=Trapa incisa TaxID=236973 RepID=A0AAN7JY52_9MYRT|nr:hypothetical protein SAY87_009738 [Trapa incisa]
MGCRTPLEHYGLRSTSSFSSLHDLNADRDAVTGDSLDNVGDSAAVDCIHNAYRTSLPLHSVGVEEYGTGLGSSSGPYGVLAIEDISPIGSARSRFMRIIVEHFIVDHDIEVNEPENDYSAHVRQDKLNNRKPGEVQYEGDPRFALPLMYVANMYETLVNDVNRKLASLNGIREKTIGVALEAAGGLYRRLTNKFPMKGTCTYRIRELATSVETRTRFPELVIQEEKRVHFVIVNGLDIVEKPNGMSIDDAEWFKRIAGRNEVAILPQDYKFHHPRHKQKPVSPNSASQIPGLATFRETENSSTMAIAQGLCSVAEWNQQATQAKHQLPIGLSFIRSTKLLMGSIPRQCHNRYHAYSTLSLPMWKAACI